MKQSANVGMHTLPYTVRPGWGSLVIMLIFGLLLSLPLLWLIGRGPSAFLPVVVILCVLWALIGAFMLAIGTQKIILQPDSIVYHTLFSRRKMPYADITQVRLEQVVGAGAHGTRVTRYILRLENRLSDKPLLINMRPFSKTDMAVVVDAIATHAPSARLNEGALQLRQGVF